MLASFPNDVKVYNLSAGKTLPEWISDRKRRKLQQDDDDLRRRITLIQDFSMPDLSHCVQITADSKYILATGSYKPRMRCYDIENLSMKFERGLDAEVIRMKVLSDNFEKVAFLEEDRWLEFHVAYGHYHRMRIPKFGRDFAYHEPSCDLYVVGSGPDIYRLNLEQGRFMIPLTTGARSLASCAMNNEHHLFVTGTDEGKIEAWDPRVKRRVGLLDCAAHADVQTMGSYSELMSVSSICFKNALMMAAGTSTGQVIMYDIRSSRPLLTKDHRSQLPIKSIDFATGDNDLVLSMDGRSLKLWHQDTGRTYTSIEPGVDLNQLCLVPRSGLLFLANEDPKILQYYLPSIGPAPKWCAFLDAITEELEESKDDPVYDDYKFLTKSGLESMGLGHLVGSNLVRAYMHGYFIDMKLYNQAKLVTNPFAFEEHKKQKVREKLEEERAGPVKKVKKLPKVNKDLASEILDQTQSNEKLKGKKKKKAMEQKSLLSDSRFSSLWKDPDFEIDQESEQFQLLNPVRLKLAGKRRKREKNVALADKFDQLEMHDQAKALKERLAEESDHAVDSSSDDDAEYIEEVKKANKSWRRRHRNDSEEDEAAPLPSTSTAQSPTATANPNQSEVAPDRVKRPPKKPKAPRPGLKELMESVSGSKLNAPKLLELRSGEEFRGWKTELESQRQQRPENAQMSLSERLKSETVSDGAEITQTDSTREITFKLERKRDKTKRERNQDHMAERKQSRRSTAAIAPKPKQPWKKKT